MNLVSAPGAGASSNAATCACISRNRKLFFKRFERLSRVGWWAFNDVSGGSTSDPINLLLLIPPLVLLQSFPPLSPLLQKLDRPFPSLPELVKSAPPEKQKYIRSSEESLG